MFISENNLAAVLGTSAAVVKSWADKGIYPAVTNEKGIRGFRMEDLTAIPEIGSMVESSWDEELISQPVREFTSVELFAGGGGLALGIEKAGFKHVLLNEFDKAACNTLRINRPQWNVIEGDVKDVDFSPLRDKVDLLTGGFPCQAFSFAGKQGGFNDARGTLFFELARATREINPKILMAENVKGLVSHDGGKTFRIICNVIKELGYTLVPPRVLKALMYKVPQKRERIILVAMRNDLAHLAQFHWPEPYNRVMTLEDAFMRGDLYENDVPSSEGASYPEKKSKVLSMVPPGGDWRDLPEDIAREYMGGSWLLGGGKTGMARRLSLDEPSLTLTCSPAQKQTERCHPLETRPLSIREYARIQTFPDNWIFQGTMTHKYKQIGNAVPVNLAWAVGRSLIRLLNDVESINPGRETDCSEAVREIIRSFELSKNTTHSDTDTSKLKTRQLSLIDLFEEFGTSPIAENPMVSESHEGYAPSDSIDVLPYKDAIVSLVKKESVKDFEQGLASVYFTGKKFPATIDLKKLYYFIPFIKGKGIRDLYIIKNIRVKDYNKDPDKIPDYRMVFEIQFIKRLFDDFQKFNLDIWHTFSVMRLSRLMHNCEQSV